MNGKEFYRTDEGDVCQNPLYLILSVEVKGDNAVSSERDENAAPADFIVDYFRAYQYIDIIDAK